MKNALWFLVGVIAGLAAGHLVSKDPRGHELLADIDARVSEFTDRVTEAYRSQEARFGGALEDAKGAAADVLETAKDAASDALDAAKKLTD
ncbi:MAG TPA: ATPase [Microbacterium sp.]|uniref:ATPase n=1 Tax=Microbacterium sp. TaxID=51671 RepID=UPI002BE53F82|nr:ATPase [Microbacterium sp.]HWI30214.1 ATPase [Microbacterium sp.]